jgi:nucleoside diphosphate kinase
VEEILASAAAGKTLLGLPTTVATTPAALTLVEVVCVVVVPQQRGSRLSPGSVLEHVERQGLGVVGARLVRLSHETAAAYVRLGHRPLEVASRLRQVTTAASRGAGRRQLMPGSDTGTAGQRSTSAALSPCFVLALQHTNAVACARELLCGGRDPGLAEGWGTEVFASASVAQAQAEVALLLRNLSSDCVWALEN